MYQAVVMQISLCIESPSPQKKSDKGSFSDFFLREGGGVGGGGVCIQAKTGRCRGYFGSWGHVLVAVAVVERWPLQRGLSKSQCINCPQEQRKRPL